MNKNVRRLTITAMLTALALVFLVLSAILPTMRLALVAIAGLATAAAIIECGVAAGIMVFIATSVLGLIISPLRGNVLVYCLFFGYYPILKGFIERLRPTFIEWMLKLILFNISLTAALMLYRAGFLSAVTIPDIAVLLVYAAANLAFVIYDIGFSKLTAFYINRFSRRNKMF